MSETIERSVSEPTVTKLQPTKRDPTRVMIRVDGAVKATLPRPVVETLGIAVGLAWTEAVEARVAEAVDRDKAERYALNALGRRALSGGELAERIRRRGHGAAVAEAVVQAMRDKRFLDDEAYGRAVIRAERARRPAGSRLLRQKLVQKRLDRSLIDRLIAELEAEQDPVAEARCLVEARLRQPSVQRLDPAARQRRLYAQLARRGFDPDTIRQAMRGTSDDDGPDPFDA